MKRKEKHTFYNYQFKHTAVKITDHPNIQSVDVAEALGIHPIMLYRWRQEMRDGKIEDNKEEKRERKGREWHFLMGNRAGSVFHLGLSYMGISQECLTAYRG